jgi:hypothetical protein
MLRPPLPLRGEQRRAGRRQALRWPGVEHPAGAHGHPGPAGPAGVHQGTARRGRGGGAARRRQRMRAGSHPPAPGAQPNADHRRYRAYRGAPPPPTPAPTPPRGADFQRGRAHIHGDGPCTAPKQEDVIRHSAHGRPVRSGGSRSVGHLRRGAARLRTMSRAGPLVGDTDAGDETLRAEPHCTLLHRWRRVQCRLFGPAPQEPGPGRLLTLRPPGSPPCVRDSGPAVHGLVWRGCSRPADGSAGATRRSVRAVQRDGAVVQPVAVAVRRQRGRHSATLLHRWRRVAECRPRTR